MNEIQSKLLSVFLEVKKICVEHKLIYFAIGGTCLGAARHNGFIPWDDDIDIAMPGDDYKKFYELAKRELPSNMTVKLTADFKNNKHFFMKVYDVTTTFIEKNEIGYPDDYKGIYIDIMPLYGIPKDYPVFKYYKYAVKTLIRFNDKMRTPFAKSFQRYSFRGEMLWLLLCPLNVLLRKIYGYKFWSDIWDRLVSRYDVKTSNYVGYTWCEIEDNLVFPKVWFDSCAELPFETTTIHCPVRWDNYLKHQFGDYLKLPQESERINHSEEAVVDCNKPFTYYQEVYKRHGGLT